MTKIYDHIDWIWSPEGKFEEPKKVIRKRSSKGRKYNDQKA
jgi:hypothetical protein